MIYDFEIAIGFEKMAAKFKTSITWPQNVRFHYFKVHFGALIEKNLMMYVTHK